MTWSCESVEKTDSCIAAGYVLHLLASECVGVDDVESATVAINLDEINTAVR